MRSEAPPHLSALAAETARCALRATYGSTWFRTSFAPRPSQHRTGVLLRAPPPSAWDALSVHDTLFDARLITSRPAKQDSDALPDCSTRSGCRVPAFRHRGKLFSEVG